MEGITSDHDQSIAGSTFLPTFCKFVKQCHSRSRSFFIHLSFINCNIVSGLENVTIELDNRVNTVEGIVGDHEARLVATEENIEGYIHFSAKLVLKGVRMPGSRK